MSVTNDAMAVVDYCFKVYPKQFDRIIYRDSTGMFDELKFFEGRFQSYAPIKIGSRCRTLEDALKAVEGSV